MNYIMKYLLPSLLLISLAGLIIPSAFAESVPDWVKNTAGWWATDAISETEFVNAIKFLVKENIIQVDTSQATETSQAVPEWVKNTAGWWATDTISEIEFVNAIAYLIKIGIITINEKLIHTDVDLRVAFIGDQGLNSNSVSVLNLIKDEGTHMVLHQGDLDYNDDPDGWERMVSSVLGDDFPYFVTIGDHDRVKWNEYQKKLYDRIKKIPDANCVGELGVQAACTYRGLFFVQVAPGLVGDVPGANLEELHGMYFPTEFAPFIDEQLNNNEHMWRICSWSYGMTNTQVGGSELDTKVGYKDEADWEVYNSCKNGGGIIANAHEHSYSRTKTLVDIQNQIVDPDWPEPDKLMVDNGSTFIFVSGIAGHSIRDQGRCLPFFYPYGCNGEWASIYTNDQWATYGALFCTFNTGGQPNKAYCYLKNIDGQIIDAFTVTSLLGGHSNNSNFIGTDMSNRNLSSDDFSNTVISDVDLSNSMLIDTDLSNRVFIGTTLANTDFTDTNLSGTSLIGNNLDGTILRGVDLTGANLLGVDLSILDLTNANLSGQDLSDHDLTDVILTGADLSRTLLPDSLDRKDFTETKFNGVDLSGKDLTKSIFDCIIHTTTIPCNNFIDTNLENSNLTSALFVNTDLTKIKNKSLAGADLFGTSITHSNLSGVNLAGTILDATNLWKTDLSGQDFTVVFNAVIQGTNFIETNLSNSNFEGVDLSSEGVFTQTFKDKAHLIRDATQPEEAASAMWEDVEISQYFISLFSKSNNVHIISTEVSGNDIVLGYIFLNNFEGANLENANFKNAKLWDANFNLANLTNADLSGADLRNASFSNADLSNANLENANLKGATLNETILTGANLKCINHSICNS